MGGSLTKEKLEQMVMKPPFIPKFKIFSDKSVQYFSEYLKVNTKKVELKEKRKANAEKDQEWFEQFE